MDFPQRVNGWALYAHPCFQETYDALVAEVETLKGKILKIIRESRHKVIGGSP